MGNDIYESDVKDNDKGNEYKGKYSPEVYQANYKRLEHLVELSRDSDIYANQDEVEFSSNLFTVFVTYRE